MNFMEVLDTNVGAIERPPLMPIGTYRWAVEKFTMGTIANGDWDVLDFTLKCVAPTEDVDTDEMAEYGDVTEKRMRYRFMFSTTDKANFEKNLFGVKRFLTNTLKVDGADTMPLKEALSNSIHHQCLGNVQWRPDPKDASVMYDEIKRTAPLD